MEFECAKYLLTEALEADEKKNFAVAFNMYSQAVEILLKVVGIYIRYMLKRNASNEQTFRNKVERLAKQALDR